MPARRIRPRLHRRTGAGFTLVELAVVLGVLGVLAMTMASAFDGLDQSRRHGAAVAHAEVARQALRAFALRNKRLPCPDTSAFGDAGREAAGAGAAACAANVGWLPYESLGLDTPVRAVRLRYGVYRGGADADLVAPQPASVDVPDLEGTGGFIATLSRAAERTASSDQPHFMAGSASPDCAAGTGIVNPAFVLVAPLADLDGRGGSHPRFDGVHATFEPSGTRCVAPPGHAASSTFDDLVVAESPAALLGWVMTTTR